MAYALTRGEFKTPYGRPVQMAYRLGTNDYNTLNACMTEDEYNLKSYRFSGTALDIGGYLGGVGIGLAIDNPDLRVIIVEPVPGNAELIRQNIASNGLDGRVELIEGAAGAKKAITVSYGYRGTEALEHHAFVGNSTLAGEATGPFDHDETVYAKPWTLSALIKHAGADRLALVKIDCEGGEWAFLADPAVAKVDTILGEWHPTNHHVIGDMLALLSPTHTVTFSGPQAGPGGFVAVAL